ncbi:MAG: orotidine-5'-phosphate decarboxylase [Verrucomicrobiota bacterium]
MPDSEKPLCIVALDYADSDSMFAFLDQAPPTSIPWVKIGLQMFCKYGSPIVKEVGERGYQIFLDLKLHDIPNTVAGAVKSLTDLPIQMLTLHGSGGAEMLSRAAEIQRDYAPNLRLLAVSVLTSMDADQLTSIGVDDPVAKQVNRLVGIAEDAGVSGIVCSPNEIESIRANFASRPFLVTPGIRPKGSGAQDQKRIKTPGEAALLGTNAMVIGRPITQASDPVQAYRDIEADIDDSLNLSRTA